MGQVGRKLLEDQHSPQEYVDGLIEFVEDAKRDRPHVALLDLAQRMGAIAGELFDARDSSAILTSTAKQICALGSIST